CLRRGVELSRDGLHCELEHRRKSEPNPAGDRNTLAAASGVRRTFRKLVAMPVISNHDRRPISEKEQTYLESLIREDYGRCHPGDTLDDLKRRAAFSKEDRGLLR